MATVTNLGVCGTANPGDAGLNVGRDIPAGRVVLIMAIAWGTLPVNWGGNLTDDAGNTHQFRASQAALAAPDLNINISCWITTLTAGLSSGDNIGGTLLIPLGSPHIFVKAWELRAGTGWTFTQGKTGGSFSGSPPSNTFSGAKSASVTATSDGVFVVGAAGAAVWEGTFNYTLTGTTVSSGDGTASWTDTTTTPDSDAKYEMFHRDGAAAGSYGATLTPDTAYGWYGILLIAVHPPPFSPTPGIRQARSGMGRVLTLETITGSVGPLRFRRWTDAHPPVPGSIQELVASGVHGCDLRRRGSGELDALYATDDGEVFHRVSRDDGQNWEAAVQVVSHADGYRNPVGLHVRGLFPILVLRSNTLDWYLTVGKLQEDGATWDYADPEFVVASAGGGQTVSQRYGDLLRLPDGSLLFATTTGSALKLLRCRDLDEFGGTWQEMTHSGLPGSFGGHNPSLAFEPNRGLLAVTSRSGVGNRGVDLWRLAADGESLSYMGGGSQIGSGTGGFYASLLRESTGQMVQAEHVGGGNPPRLFRSKSPGNPPWTWLDG